MRFPPLRITEVKMTNKEILETFNTRIIHIDQENEAREDEWTMLWTVSALSGLRQDIWVTRITIRLVLSTREHPSLGGSLRQAQRREAACPRPT